MTLAEWAERPASDEVPSSEDVLELRHFLASELEAVVADWPNRPPEPLRITKRRLRSMANCPAQELATVEEPGGAALSFNLAAGIVCDLAAGLLSVSPSYPAEGGWFTSMRASIGFERPELLTFVDELDTSERDEFEALVDERCRELPTLLGDISIHRPTSHERITVRFDAADVLLNAELDLAVGRHHRVLAEVKTGTYNNWIPEELRHYGLLVALRDKKAANVGVAITLKDQRLTPVSLGIEELHLAAKRVVSTARSLVTVDLAVQAGEPVPTVPADHCRWCPRLGRCDAVGDLLLASIETESGLR